MLPPAGGVNPPLQASRWSGRGYNTAIVEAALRRQVWRDKPAATGNGVIVGLGVDIAEVNRVEAAIRRHGEAFLRRVFTPEEIAYCEGHRNKFERYAGRFAAKEAAMKALGTGWRRGIHWLDIAVTRNSAGKPSLELSGRAKEIAGQLGVKHISLSITHSTTTALAQVIFEQ